MKLMKACTERSMAYMIRTRNMKGTVEWHTWGMAVPEEETTTLTWSQITNTALGAYGTDLPGG